MAANIWNGRISFVCRSIIKCDGLLKSFFEALPDGGGSDSGYGGKFYPWIFGCGRIQDYLLMCIFKISDFYLY